MKLSEGYLISYSLFAAFGFFGLLENEKWGWKGEN